MPRDVVAHWLEICWSTGGLEIPGSNPAFSTMILGHCVTRYRPIRPTLIRHLLSQPQAYMIDWDGTP